MKKTQDVKISTKEDTQKWCLRHQKGRYGQRSLNEIDWGPLEFASLDIIGLEWP